MRVISIPLIRGTFLAIAMLAIAEEAHTTVAGFTVNSYEELVQVADLIVIAKPLPDRLKPDLLSVKEPPHSSNIFQEFEIVECLGSVAEGSNFHIPKVGSRIGVSPHYLTAWLVIKDLKTQEVHNYVKGPSDVSFKLPNYIPPKDFGNEDVILFLTVPYRSNSKDKLQRYDLAAHRAILEKTFANKVKEAIKLFPEKFSRNK